MTTMTPKERRQLVLDTAQIENKHLRAMHGGRTPNYGIVPDNQKLRGGGPRTSEIKRSKPAQNLLRLAQQGFSLADAARITNRRVEDVLNTAHRYQIKFKGSNQGHG